MDTGSWIFFNKKLILDYYFCLKSGVAVIFKCWGKPGYPEKTTDLQQVPVKLHHIKLYRVHLPWAGFKLTYIVYSGRGRMVVWFITTYAISAYHH
jgi:hypothetical protein